MHANKLLLLYYVLFDRIDLLFNCEIHSKKNKGNLIVHTKIT